MINFSFSSTKYGRQALHLSWSYRMIMYWAPRSDAHVKHQGPEAARRPRFVGGPAVLDTSNPRLLMPEDSPPSSESSVFYGSTQTSLARSTCTASSCSRKHIHVHNMPRSSMKCNEASKYLNCIMILLFVARTISNAYLKSKLKSNQRNHRSLMTQRD